MKLVKEGDEMLLLQKPSYMIVIVIFAIIFTTACSKQEIGSGISLKVAAESEFDDKSKSEIREDVVEDDTLNFAIVSIHSIPETHRMYYKFINYLESELGMKVEIIQK